VDDTSIVSANLADYFDAPQKEQEPADVIINRHTRRHEKALLRRAGKRRRG
jgi:hypothetical protein